jgi:hypothetical protein
MTRRLTTKQREDLYDAEVAKARATGRGDFPICNLCGVGIFPGQKWHVSHDPHHPRALGGAVDGLAHDRCNTQHNHAHDTPLVAKVNRIRQKHIGAYQPDRPMLGSVASGIAKPFRGPPLDRRTGMPWRPRQ